MISTLLNIALLAQNKEEATGKGLSGFGKIGLEGGGKPIEILEGILTIAVGFLTIAAILWFTLQIILGGFTWISAGGDPKAAESARKRLTNAVIGIVVVFAALTIVGLVGKLLGIPNILNIAELLGKTRGQ